MKNKTIPIDLRTNDICHDIMFNVKKNSSLQKKLDFIKMISYSIQDYERCGYIFLDISPDSIIINSALDNTLVFSFSHMIKESEIDSLSIDNLKFMSKYITPQMSILIKNPWNFNLLKNVYVDKSLNSHALALLLYDLLFNELPSQQLLYGKYNKIEVLTKQLIKIYNISSDLSQDIASFIINMLNSIEKKRLCHCCVDFSAYIDDFIKRLSNENNIQRCCAIQ